MEWLVGLETRLRTRVTQMLGTVKTSQRQSAYKRILTRTGRQDDAGLSSEAIVKLK
jgi:hypothetical protein